MPGRVLQDWCSVYLFSVLRRICQLYLDQPDCKIPLLIPLQALQLKSLCNNKTLMESLTVQPIEDPPRTQNFLGISSALINYGKVKKSWFHFDIIWCRLSFRRSWINLLIIKISYWHSLPTLLNIRFHFPRLLCTGVIPFIYLAYVNLLIYTKMRQNSLSSVRSRLGWNQ